MRKNTLFVLITIFLVALFTSACGSSPDQNSGADNNNDANIVDEEDKADDELNNSGDDDSDENSEEAEVTNSNEDQNNNKSEEQQNNQDDFENTETNGSEITEDEAKELVIDYIKENEPETAEFVDTYDFLMEEEDDKYRVDMFPSVSTDEEKGAPLISSYEVDRATGDVERVEDKK